VWKTFTLPSPYASPSFLTSKADPISSLVTFSRDGMLILLRHGCSPPFSSFLSPLSSSSWKSIARNVASTIYTPRTPSPPVCLGSSPPFPTFTQERMVKLLFFNCPARRAVSGKNPVTFRLPCHHPLHSLFFPFPFRVNGGSVLPFALLVFPTTINDCFKLLLCVLVSFPFWVCTRSEFPRFLLREWNS